MGAPRLLLADFAVFELTQHPSFSLPGTNAPLRHLTQIAVEVRGMSDVQKYRQQAEECRKMADKAFSPLDKEAWLQLAADWLRLVQMVEQREGRHRQSE